MEEAEETSVSTEVAPPEAQVQTQQEEQRQPEESHQEKNWKAARQRLAELERQNREKDELLKKALDLQSQRSQPVVEEKEEADDEYIPKGRVKSLARKQFEPLEKEVQELKKELAEQKQRELFNSLRSKYRDFDDVVNPETLALLEEKKPFLAKTIAGIKDPYELGVEAYDCIKEFGILNDVPGKRHAKEAEKKLEKNSKTIQSPLAYDKRPMAQAFKLTEQTKSELWAEMNTYGNMASSVPPLG